MIPSWIIEKNNKKHKKEEFQPQPLYIEDYSIYYREKRPKDADKENAEENSTIIVIDIF